MKNEYIHSLADCSEYRQTLLARPPRLAHGAALLLAALLVAAVAWSALTEADLIVPAPGRMRPVDAPTDVYVTSSGRPEDQLGRRVVAVEYREGAEVGAGDVLLRLDTSALDREIERQSGALNSAREERARVAGLDKLLGEQLVALDEKSAAELAQIEQEIERQQKQRELSITRAEEVLAAARETAERYRAAYENEGAGSGAELRQLEDRVREAEAKLASAKLPIDTSRLEVQRRAIELSRKDLAMRSEELALQKVAKDREIEQLEAALAELRQKRDESIVRAPRDGVVISKELTPGDLVTPNEPAVTIAGDEGLVFEAVVSSAHAGELEVGMPARVKIDAFDYQQYGALPGKVVFVSSDSGVVERGEKSGAFYNVRRGPRPREVHRKRRAGPRPPRHDGPGRRHHRPGQPAVAAVQQGPQDRQPGVSVTTSPTCSRGGRSTRCCRRDRRWGRG